MIGWQEEHPTNSSNLDRFCSRMGKGGPEGELTDPGLSVKNRTEVIHSSTSLFAGTYVAVVGMPTKDIDPSLQARTNKLMLTYWQ